MARRRTGTLLLVAALLALAGGTVAVLLSGEAVEPRLGGPHRIERHAVAAFPGTSPAGDDDAPGTPTVTTEVLAPAELLVRVLRSRDEAPVPGARVRLQDLSSVWTGVADERGEVRYSGVEAGTCSLFASAEGYTVRRQVVTLGKGGNPEVVLRIGESPIVEGRVVSSMDGKPISGAGVRAEGMDGSRSASAVTGGDGTFRLRAGEEGRSVTLGLRAAGYAPKSLWIPLPAKSASGASVEIALDPSGVLRGVVRDPSGRPAPGAEVVAYPVGAGFAPPHRFLPRLDDGSDARLGTETGADGSYALEGLARGGLYSVAADGPGFAPSEEKEVFLPEDEAEASADLDLRACGSIVATWSVEGLPNGGTLSAILRPAEGRDILASAWGPGTCRFTEVAAGRYEVDVISVKRGTAHVEVRAGETVTVDVHLSATVREEGAVIEGIVTDARGSPVSRVSVSAFSAVQEGLQPPALPAGVRQFDLGRTAFLVGRMMTEIPGRGMVDLSGMATTDGEGRFRVGGLKDAGRYCLSAASPAGIAPPSDPLTAPATGVSLVLSALGRVKGRLVLPAGAAKPRFFNVSAGGIESSARFGSVAGGGFGQGTFETMPLPPGLQRLAAVAGEFLLPPREVEVRAGETLDLGDLTLERGVTIKGRVVDPESKPVPQAIVGFVGPFGARAVSGIDGRFEAGPVQAGEASVPLALMGGVSVVRAVVVPPEGEVGDLVLPRGGILRVQATGEGGRPFVGAIEVRGAGWGRTDHMGRYSVSLVPGEYWVVIHDPADSAREVAEAPATVTEGEETRVDLRVGP